jgi:hypothetical protein
MNDMFTVSGPLSEDNRCAIHTSFSVNNNWPYDWSSDCAYKVFVFNKTSIADIINTHENLNAVAGGSYNIEDYDVFFNIRSSNQNPEQMLEWIYNGGTWIGEWSSNDYPINNWNLIQGSVNGGTSGAQGTPIIHIPSHWLAQNVDWNSVPVGSEAVQFMRNITINDPDANVIVSLNHRSFGEVPLLVEKRYGDGTIILFNCDYQDDPASVSDLIQKVAHYAAEFVGDEADIDINTDPLITSVPSINALDGSLYEYSVYSSDADGDDIVVTATTKPDWLSVSNNNSNFLNFDGDYDYVELPELGDPVDAMTVQFWLKKSVNSDVAFIMGQTGWSDQYLHLDVTDDSDGQKINFSINNGGYSSSEDNVVVDDGWHNIAVTYENSTIKFYYDGNPWGEVQNNGSLININGFRLGNHFNDSRWLSGNLDNYAIWSIALSESEVQSNMNTALTGDEPGLIGYWNFDESEGTTLTDLSGNGNNGTIYGATWESSSTTVLSGTPSNSDGGLHEIVLTAEDGNGGIATQSYTLAVSLHSLEISGETSFRMFSSPVSGTIFGDLLDELWTQGAEGSDNPNSNPNIWTFENEWNSVTDFGADALAAGQGFLMYVYADTDFDGEDDLPVTISIDGEQHQSGVSVDSEPSACNMMGNPYGLAVDISQMLTDNNSTFNSTVYALDLVNPGYKFHNGNIGNIDDGEIKPFEGFWIESNEDGNTFHFTEQSIKKGSLESPARTSRDGSNGHAVFTFSNGTYSTSTYLSFTPEGEINLDPADADRLIPMTLVEHLTSMIYESNKSLAINNLPSDLSVDLMMDMDVMMLAPNSNNGYTTQAEQIDFTWDITSLPEGITVGLIDNVTGQAINLAESTSTGISTIDKGSFETSGGFMGTYPAVGESQFTLTIYGITTASVEDEILPARVALNGAYPNPFNPSTIISFDLKETEMVSLEIFDIAGRQVATLVDKQMIPGKHQVSWNPVNLSSGLYLVNLVVGLETFNQKITYIK